MSQSQKNNRTYKKGGSQQTNLSIGYHLYNFKTILQHYMEDLIKQIVTGLSSVQNILLRIIQQEEVSMEEKVSLFDFFKKHEQVSDLVAFIKGNDILPDDILSLSNNCQSFIYFYNDNESALSSFNPSEECKAYLAPYRQEVETEGKTWAKLDTEKRHLSDRMDYMDCDSEKFKQMDAECDRLIELRDIHKARQNKAYAMLREKECYVAGFYFFQLEMLFILVNRMHDVCTYLISKYKKGDGL